MSRRNVASGPQERILDAAAQCVRSTGRHRVAVTDVARQAGVSRPTVYRYFADGEAVLRALWQRDLTRLIEDVPQEPTDLTAFVAQLVAIAETISDDETLAPTFAAEPALMARYLVERFGAGQRAIRARLREGIASLQRDGQVRAGAPDQLAVMALLIAQSAIQSRPMVTEALPGPAWRRELGYALTGYLAP